MSTKQLERKVDLLFGVIANQFLATQAIQVFQSIQENMEDEDADKEALQEVLKKSMESYKHHSEGVNDAISYYYDLFGTEANAEMLKMLQEAGIGTGEEPEPVTEVKAKGNRKSTKAD
jgi:hypothetical protein